MTEAKVPVLAIVGGGLSGSLLAMQVLHQAQSPLHIQLFEKSSELGRGIAYGTEQAIHRLNVPAAKMSAWPQDSEHLLRWAQQQGLAGVEPESFLTRHDYGSYIQSCLAQAIAAAAPGVSLSPQHQAVVNLITGPQGGFELMAQGNLYSADQVVLALGNAPDVLPAGVAWPNSPRLIANPWKTGALAGIPRDESVLILGTGLTMVDKVLELFAQGHRGQIYILSRSGLLPQDHDLSQTPQVWAQDFSGQELRIRYLLQAFRQELAAGHNWRSLIDGLRHQTPALWQALPEAEKRRFLRHLRPYWDSHRHRMAPELFTHWQSLLSSSQLQSLAGRVKLCKAQLMSLVLQIQPRGQTQIQHLEVNWILNGAGSGASFTKRQDPLVQALLHRGLITPDPLDLGLLALSDGALLNAQGLVTPGLYTLGPPLKGLQLESTAVPEIREQAKNLAQRLLNEKKPNNHAFDCLW